MKHNCHNQRLQARQQLNRLIPVCFDVLSSSNSSAKFTALCIISRIIDVDIWRATKDSLSADEPAQQTSEPIVTSRQTSETTVTSCSVTVETNGTAKSSGVSEPVKRSVESTAGDRPLNNVTDLSTKKTTDCPANKMADVKVHKVMTEAVASRPCDRLTITPLTKKLSVPSPVVRCDSLERATRAGLENVAQNSMRMNNETSGPHARQRPPSWKRPSSFHHRESQRSLTASASVVITPEELSRGGCSMVDTSPVDAAAPHDSFRCGTGVGTENTDRSTLDVLSSRDPSTLIGVLQESIVNQKQSMGARHRCTPSVRWRHCTHHCLQILSARVFTVMCHTNAVQHKVVNGGHLKMLVDALDPNHDPVRSNCRYLYVFNTRGIP